MNWPDQRRASCRAAQAEVAASGRVMRRATMNPLVGLVGALTLSLVSCGATTGNLPGPPRWQAATPTAWLGGKEVRLQASLSRDFMPTTWQPDMPPGSLRRGLLATVLVKPVDGSQLPHGVQIDAVWVVQGNEVWAAPLTQQGRWGRGEAYGVVAREGPTWERETFADVFAHARDAAGQTALLVIRGQRIVKTW